MDERASRLARDPFDLERQDVALGDIPGAPAGGDGSSGESVRGPGAIAHGRVAFTILGEPASKANSRKLVILGSGPKARAGSIKSDKARAYEKAAILQVPHWARVMFTGPVRVTAVIFYATERPDLDESVVLDVLQADFEKKGDERVLVRRGVYRNDRQVREKHIYHRIDAAKPRTEIVVEALTPQQGALV